MQADQEQEILRAATRLVHGELVAFPTETVYGLGADAENPQAVAKIYQAKGRPSNHPVIVHVAPDADLSYWARDIPEEARQLIKAFWPGPLTLILPRASHIPDAVSGGQSSVGIRCPSHPVAQALLRQFARLKPSGQGGVAAPSANKFGQVSPTLAEHVISEFPEEVAKGMPVLQGGAANIGIESTIVDLSRIGQGVGAVLLRPGHISASQIGQVLGYTPQLPDSHAPRASGTLKAHYAPRTPLMLFSSQELAEGKLQHRVPAGQKWAVCVFDAGQQPHTEGIDWFEVSNEPVQYAHDLYAFLRRVDQLGYQRICIQSLPEDHRWEAVNDRLQRAAAAFPR
uniref:Threonylcarbamoyl-AMP synthase n=1 Tax=uncultured bacterium IN-13 TaxID=1805591 RepID=A0A142BWH4_9BACT|nr:threonylcarbamoyl-AMP synthase [uncultured bacterium IN-13]